MFFHCPCLLNQDKKLLHLPKSQINYEKKKNNKILGHRLKKWPFEKN